LRKLAFLFGGLLLVIGSPAASRDVIPKADALSYRNFDEYGLIRWEDEKARLDNFAIQIQNDPEIIGYVFVFDGNDVCEGEAKARAIRARDYVVNYRGIPWNRVMWRYDGFAGEFKTALQPAARAVKIPDPWLGPFEDVPAIKHITERCDLRFKKIRGSKP
jgi:hypothetical protein